MQRLQGCLIGAPRARRRERAGRYSATPFFFGICHTFSGVIGMSTCVTPRCPAQEYVDSVRNARNADRISG